MKPKLLYGMVILLACLLIVITILLVLNLSSSEKPKPLGLFKKKRYQTSLSPMDDLGILTRFARLRDLWYGISSNKGFVELANNLGDVNSEALFADIGSVDILRAYNELNSYVKKMNMDKDTRITLIYTDGIVFYDSALPIHRIFFMQNGLPKPVSMATLGSPLKNHNVVPEMTNAVVVHNVNQPMYFLGYPLNNPLYKELVKEGFGFFERISSSLNVPYSYMAKFLHLPSVNGPTTFFLDGFILRIGLPIADNFFQLSK